MSTTGETQPERPATVLLTRSTEDNAPLRTLLESRRMRVLELPLIAIAPPDDVDALDRALGRLFRYQWIVFTSRHAVRATLDRLATVQRTLPPGIRIAAVGPATAAELRSRGRTADVVSRGSTALSLAQALGSRVARAAVLMPVGDLADCRLQRALERAGARVERVIAYRTVPPPFVDRSVLASLGGGEVDVVVLASPSAARNLISLVENDVLRAPSVRLVCIGPTTGDAVRDLGLQPAGIAIERTPAALAEVIVEITEEMHRERP